MNPDRERRRQEAAQAAATAQAKTGMTHPGADMVRVFSIAGFEIADIFAEWSRRTSVDMDARSDPAKAPYPEPAGMANGLGPPWRMTGESPEQFGQRVAAAVLQLIKEV